MRVLSVFGIRPEVVKTAPLIHAWPLVFVEPNIESLLSKLKSGTLRNLQQPLSESDIHALLVNRKTLKQSKPSHGTIADTKGIWL
jgi:hypothetical protein